MGLAARVIPRLSSSKLRTPPAATQPTDDGTTAGPSPTPRKCSCWKFVLKDILFGGKVVVMGGDFRQLLPVIPRGTKG